MCVWRKKGISSDPQGTNRLRKRKKKEKEKKRKKKGGGDIEGGCLFPLLLSFLSHHQLLPCFFSTCFCFEYLCVCVCVCVCACLCAMIVYRKVAKTKKLIAQSWKKRTEFSSPPDISGRVLVERDTEKVIDTGHSCDMQAKTAYSRSLVCV